MAFQKIKHTNPRRGRKVGASLTIHKTGSVSLSADAYTMLGEPVAVVMQWDPDTTTLLLSASSPDDPDAVRLDGKAGPKFSGRDLMRHAGLDHGGVTRRFPVAPYGRAAVTADLQDMPAARTPMPLRRAS